jgi:hypothetical protein
MLKFESAKPAQSADDIEAQLMEWAGRVNKDRKRKGRKRNGNNRNP